MISRAHRTPFGEWWWTVDRLTLAAIGALMLAGVVLSLAASPPVAGRLGLDPFYFVNRHILFLFPTIAVLLGVSFLNPRQIRRLSLLVFVISLLMVASTPYFGAEIKGARRWLVHSRHQHPAVGIPQAGFRHSHRLAVCANWRAIRTCPRTRCRWRCCWR